MGKILTFAVYSHVIYRQKLIFKLISKILKLEGGSGPVLIIIEELFCIISSLLKVGRKGLQIKKGLKVYFLRGKRFKNQEIATEITKLVGKTFLGQYLKKMLAQTITQYHIFLLNYTYQVYHTWCIAFSKESAQKYDYLLT